MNDNIIHLKTIITEDFLNYKKPSMFLISSICDFKCLNELGLDTSLCQNQSITLQNTLEFNISDIIDIYQKNDIIKAVVIGGLEPFMQFEEILNFIEAFRKKCNDEIVIYTGYYKDEIKEEINLLTKYSNIIVKFGRFIPNQEFHFDPILGINLISDNQYAERIS